MSIQEIALSNHQKKKIGRAINDDSIIYQEENGDWVLSMAAYQLLKDDTHLHPIEDIIGEAEMDSEAQYVVFV